MDKTQFHRINRVLGDQTRFEILEKVAGADELACASLAEELPVSQATISHHLKELDSAGLLETRREGKFAFFRLKRKVWKDYESELRKRLNPSGKSRIS